MSYVHQQPHPAYLDHQDSFQSTGSDRGLVGAGYGDRSTDHFGPGDFNGALEQPGLRERATYPPGQGGKDEDDYHYGAEGAVVTRGSIAAQVSEGQGGRRDTE